MSFAMKLSFFFINYYFLDLQVKTSIDNQFKKAIEQYRDNIDLQNAIDSVQEGVSSETTFCMYMYMYVSFEWLGIRPTHTSSLFTVSSIFQLDQVWFGSDLPDFLNVIPSSFKKHCHKNKVRCRS